MSSVTHSLVCVCVYALSVSVCMCLFGAQQTKHSLYRQTHTHTWDKAQTLVYFIFSVNNQRKGSICVYLVWVCQWLDGKEIFCGSIPPPSPLSVPPTLSLFRFIFPLSSVSLSHTHTFTTHHRISNLPALHKCCRMNRLYLPVYGICQGPFFPSR